MIKFEEVYEPEHRYIASHACRCGAETKASVLGQDIFRWRQGTDAQTAFPYLSVDEREAIFISGVCAACWNNMFGEDE